MFSDAHITKRFVFVDSWFSFYVSSYSGFIRFVGFSPVCVAFCFLTTLTMTVEIRKGRGAGAVCDHIRINNLTWLNKRLN